jgi:hypothetical protein
MNLADMSNEQREEHKIRVSKQIGLDPALNLLDYFWIPQEGGLSSLVLYAKRGAAEILREKNDVHVTVLTRQDGPGYVCFTAEGVNKAGRPEIAIGSASIEGLRGEKLASAVMTASTRALRRLTMQFAGCGVLDESEVYGVPATNATPAASNAQLAGSSVVMPPPQAVPNSEVGKDITSAPIEAKTEYRIPFVPHVGETVKFETQEQFEARQAELRDDAKAQLGAQNPPKEGDSSQGIAEEPRKRRGRGPGRKNTKDISSPGQEPVQTEMPAGHIDANANITPIQPVSSNVETAPKTETAPVSALGDIPQSQVSATSPVLTPQPNLVVTPVQQPNKVDTVQQPVITKTTIEMTDPPKVTHELALTEAEKAAYLMKWKDYAQNILPAQGKMMPLDSVGGPTMQLRKFVLVSTGSAVTDLDREQWEEVFGFMDSYLAKNGAPALVEYIQKAIQGK